MAGPSQNARESKLAKAYEFLIGRAEQGRSFSVQELSDSAGWKPSTPRTYIDKMWHGLVSREGNICVVEPNLLGLSLANFLGLSSQRRSYDHNLEFTEAQSPDLWRHSLKAKVQQIFVLGDERFELQGKIGNGAVGMVRGARRLNDGTPFAVKFLAPDPKYINERFAADVARRFKREGLRGAELSHKNIIKILGYCENKDGQAFVDADGPKNPFLLMERGHSTLEQYISRNSITEGRFAPNPETVSIALQLIESVSYLHGLGIIHRDIKPSNVFVHRAGNSGLPVVKIGDFGVVHWGDFHASVTSGDLTVSHQRGLGTQKYLPLEQVTSAKVADWRSDCYSLGVTLFELLTARIIPSVHHVIQIVTTNSSGRANLGNLTAIGYQCDPDDLPLLQTILDMIRMDPDDRLPLDRCAERIRQLSEPGNLATVFASATSFPASESTSTLEPTILSMTDGRLSALEAARLHIFSASQIAPYAQTTIGVHELNLAFRHRKEMKLSKGELRFLATVLLEDRPNLNPGWFWFKDELRVLEELGSPPQSQFQVYAARLLQLNASTENGPVGPDSIKSALWGIEIKSHLWNILLAFMVKREPRVCLELLLEAGPPYDRNVLEELLLCFRELDTEQLVTLTSSSDSKLSTFAARALIESGCGSSYLLQSTAGANPGAAMHLFKELASRREPLNLETIKALEAPSPFSSSGPNVVDILALALRAKGRQELEASLDFYDLDGPALYRSLAWVDFAALANHIRSDIETQFRRLKVGTHWPQEFEKYDGFLQKLYLVEALNILSEFGNCEDAKLLGLPFLLTTKDSRIQEAAGQLVSRKGDQEVWVSLLKELRSREESYPGLQTQTLLELSNRLGLDFSLLLSSDDPVVKEKTLRFMHEKKLSATPTLFMPLLRDDRAHVRLLALDALLHSDDPGFLERLLDDYFTDFPIYYDVTCWLDRFLFAPAEFREAYKMQWKYDLQQLNGIFRSD